MAIALAARLGRAALVAGVVGLVLSAIDLATRPGCPDNYVRLVDLELVLPVLAVLCAVVGAVVLTRSRRRPSGRLAAAVAAVALVVAVLTGASAAVWFVLHRDEGSARSECWTFGLAGRAGPEAQATSAAGAENWAW